MKVDENICGATFYLKSGTYQYQYQGTYQAEPKEALPIRRLLCQRTAEGEILKYKRDDCCNHQNHQQMTITMVSFQNGCAGDLRSLLSHEKQQCQR